MSPSAGGFLLNGRLLDSLIEALGSGFRELPIMLVCRGPVVTGGGRGFERSYEATVQIVPLAFEGDGDMHSPDSAPTPPA